MDLRNWEIDISGSAIVGATVTVYAASLVHPNAGAPLVASVQTDTSGKWEFTGLVAGAKDVKVEMTIGGIPRTKWYKGMTIHSVGLLLIDGAMTVTGALAVTGTSTLTGAVTTPAALSANSVNVNTTGAAAGEVKTSSHLKPGGSVFPGGQSTWSMASISNSVSVADGASITIGTGPIGVFWVYNHSTGHSALVFCMGAANTVAQIAVTAALQFDINTGVDNNRVNIYHDGTNYIVKNQTGGNQFYSILRLMGS